MPRKLDTLLIFWTGDVNNVALTGLNAKFAPTLPFMSLALKEVQHQFQYHKLIILVATPEITYHTIQLPNPPQKKYLYAALMHHLRPTLLETDEEIILSHRPTAEKNVYEASVISVKDLTTIRQLCLESHLHPHQIISLIGLHPTTKNRLSIFQYQNHAWVFGPEWLVATQREALPILLEQWLTTHKVKEISLYTLKGNPSDTLNETKKIKLNTFACPTLSTLFEKMLLTEKIANAPKFSEQLRPRLRQRLEKFSLTRVTLTLAMCCVISIVGNRLFDNFLLKQHYQALNEHLKEMKEKTPNHNSAPSFNEENNAALFLKMLHKIESHNQHLDFQKILFENGQLTVWTQTTSPKAKKKFRKQFKHSRIVLRELPQTETAIVKTETPPRARDHVALLKKFIFLPKG